MVVVAFDRVGGARVADVIEAVIAGARHALDLVVGHEEVLLCVCACVRHVSRAWCAALRNATVRTFQRMKMASLSRVGRSRSSLGTDDSSFLNCAKALNLLQCCLSTYSHASHLRVRNEWHGPMISPSKYVVSTGNSSVRPEIER